MSTSASFTMTSDCAQCIICLKNTESSPVHFDKDALLIERQFSVVYLVNKLLEIPSEVCANYLSKFGNPEEWISICGDCSSLVGEGRQLFNQIKRLERKHKAIGEQLRLKMKFKSEDKEQSILGQSTFEIRNYLDTLDDLEDEEDLGNEEDDNWLIVDETLEHLPEKLSEEIEKKKNGRKRKIEQKDSSSRPKRSVSKPGRYFQEQFSEAEDEGEVELNLGENSEDEDSLNIRKVSPQKNKKSSRPKRSASKSREKQAEVELNLEENCEDPLQENCKVKNQPRKRNREKPNINCPKPGCQRKFARKGNLLQHLRRKHPPPKVELTAEEMAAEPLNFAQVLEKHEELIAELEKEPQHEGQRAKEKESPSLAHLALVHKVKEFSCQVCAKVYKTFEGWNNHFNGNMGICRLSAAAAKLKPKLVDIPGIFQNVVCSVEGCNNVFGMLKKMEYHIRLQHLDKEELRCKGCSVIYNKEAEYDKHYSQALDSNPSSPCVLNGIKCGQCRHVYSSQATLEIHQKLVHEPNRVFPCFKCLQCGDVFKSKNGLKLHIATKHDFSTIGLYPCPKPGCSKSFRTKGNLRSHLTCTHGAMEGMEKKFKCHFENCNSAFLSNGKLARHLKIHNTENPVVCEVCGKGFKMKNYLTIHSWQHDPAMRHKYKEYRDNKLAKKRRLEQQQVSE